MEDLITELEAATEGNRELDVEVWRQLIGHTYSVAYASELKECPHYTTSLDAALTLVPESACNHDLSSYIGHGRDDWEETAWMFSFSDTKQLVGEIAAKEEIALLKKSYSEVFGGDRFRGPPLTTLERCIAESFMSFAGIGPTPALALTIAALRALNKRN